MIEDSQKSFNNHKNAPISNLVTTNRVEESKTVSESPGFEKKHRKRSQKPKIDENPTTIFDRHINIAKIVGQNMENVSLYALCRAWLRDDSDHQLRVSTVDENPEVMEINSIKLLPPEPKTNVLTPIPKLSSNCSVEDIDDKELLENHLKYWKTLKNHTKEQNNLKLQRFKHRLKIILPSNVYEEEVENKIFKNVKSIKDMKNTDMMNHTPTPMQPVEDLNQPIIVTEDIEMKN